MGLFDFFKKKKEEHSSTEAMKISEGFEVVIPEAEFWLNPTKKANKDD